MSVKNVIQRQYQEIVDKAADKSRGITVPAEGWLTTVRKALGMSAAELARQLGKSRALISQTEKAEIGGGVSLKTMTAFAEAMNCKFVYAIVPEDTMQGILQEQAYRKARQIVQTSSTHMALEKQVLTNDQMDREVERLARELLWKMPSDFWKNET